MSVVINYDGFDGISYCTSADTEGHFTCMPELAKQINTMPKMIELMQLLATMGCMCLTRETIVYNSVESDSSVAKCLTCECKGLLKEAGVDEIER